MSTPAQETPSMKEEAVTQQPQDREILTAEEVAELLRMSVRMVRRYGRDGRLPAYKLPGGRKFIFLRAEIYEFLRQHPATEAVS